MLLSAAEWAAVGCSGAEWASNAAVDVLPQRPCENVAFPIGFCSPPPPDLPLGGFATLFALILRSGRCPNSLTRGWGMGPIASCKTQHFLVRKLF